jgi:uncharacterized membrane protein
MPRLEGFARLWPEDSWALHRVRRDRALARGWSAHLGGETLVDEERVQLRRTFEDAVAAADREYGDQHRETMQARRQLAQFDSLQELASPPDSRP